MIRNLFSWAPLVICVLLLSGHAAAQDACFNLAGGAAGGAQTLVGVHDTVRVSAGCEYALTSAGPFRPAGPLVGSDVDFLQVVQHLSGSTPSAGDPRIVYGRRRSRGASATALILRYCAHYVVEEQLGFRVVPEATAGSLRVERVAPAGCGADRLELRAVSGLGTQQLYVGSVEHTLRVGEPRLALPQGDWSIYAARPGSPVGLRVGVFRSQRVVTPLQNHLRSVGLAANQADPPLLAAHWDITGPGLLFHPSPHAMQQELLWPELRTAADAGFLWVARVAEEGVPDAPPVVLGLVQLEATDPAAIRLPDRIVRDHMREVYGGAGDSLAPSTDDWNAIFGELAVCLTPNYIDGTVAAVGAPVPDVGACATLRGLSVYAQADAARSSAPRFCIRHAMQVVTSDGAEQDLGEPECFVLPAPGDADRAPFRIGVGGDIVTLEGDGLCLMLDGATLAPDEDGEYVLRSGLLEVRQGGGADCTSRQAISRLRLPVIDPERDWHPVGMYTGGDESSMQCPPRPSLGAEQIETDESICPWRAIAHDENRYFAFVDPRHELDFSLSTSPQVAAVLSRDPNRSVQLTQDVPVLSGVRGAFEGPPEPAVVAYISREDTCPSDVPYGELRERPPIDVDALLVDATFHVFLLAVEDTESTVQCLARASFRARSSRAVVAETVGDFLGLELGILGDTSAVFFANDPIALGLALPLVWFRITPGIRFVAIEVAGNLVMSAAFDPAELSRVGVALSFALTFGIPEYLPRILSVGGMLHGSAQTSTVDNPILSFFVGLNLSTLIDLAGGR